MKTNDTGGTIWLKSPVANLYRYAPTGTYYAKPRIKGKIKSKTLHTDKLSVAKLRLADFLREEHRKASANENVINGKMTFGDAVERFKADLEADKSLKPRSKQYRLERLGALLRTWPDLISTDLAKIKEHHCAEWAANFGKKASATAFNNTVGTLRMILTVGEKCGARYDNPARNISKHRVRAKKLELPSQSQFLQLVACVESVRFGRTKHCADLIRFLAYGGFRKGEAKRVKWADCDFEKGKIRVEGDADTGTKNWEIRNVPMIPEMKLLLNKIRQQRPAATADETVMSVAECQGALTSACKAVGIKRIVHHDLRHLFATRAIESGVDIPTVSKWLGHKDGGALAMKTYGHLREEHSTKMAELVSFGSVEKSESTPTVQAPEVESPFRLFVEPGGDTATVQTGNEVSENFSTKL